MWGQTSLARYLQCTDIQQEAETEIPSAGCQMWYWKNLFKQTDILSARRDHQHATCSQETLQVQKRLCFNQRGLELERKEVPKVKAWNLSCGSPYPCSNHPGPLQHSCYCFNLNRCVTESKVRPTMKVTAQ